MSAATLTPTTSASATPSVPSPTPSRTASLSDGASPSVTPSALFTYAAPSISAVSSSAGDGIALPTLFGIAAAFALAILALFVFWVRYRGGKGAPRAGSTRPIRAGGSYRERIASHRAAYTPAAGGISVRSPLSRRGTTP